MSPTGSGADVVLVDAHHDAPAGVDVALVAVGALLDLALDEAGLDGRQHPAQLVDLVDVVLGLALDLVGEVLDVVAAGQRVDGVGDAGLVGDDLLGAQGDADRCLGGQRQRLVAGIGVQRLGAAQHRRQGLQRDADDVVVGLLRRQRGAAGLGVEAQHPGPRDPWRRSGPA